MTKDESNHYGVSISLKSNNSKLARINRYNNKSLFRLITLSSILIYIICSVLFFKPGHASLSLSTRETVVGSAPYLTLDNGKTKITEASDLLRFSFKDDKGITYTLNKSTNTTTAEKPFALPYSSIKTFADLDFPMLHGLLISPRDSHVFYFNESRFNDYFRDDDGDEIIGKTGSLLLNFYKGSFEDTLISYKSSDKLDPCDDYYKIVFSLSNFQIYSRSGNPKYALTGFANDQATFYVRSEPSEPLACWATPNLVHLYSENMRGPSSQWVDKKGFLLQDVNEPAKNFPTVGAHGLFFDLTIAGALSKDVSYTKQPSDSNISLDLSLKENEKESNFKKLNVKLVGPKDGVSKTNASVKPTTFIIYAGTEKKVPIYSFTISKWFILKPGLGEGYESSEAYCNNIGYQIASVSDLTNANNNFYPHWDKGLPGQGNNYQRRIGGGLLPEWGEILQNYYQNLPFVNKTDFYVFWAREEAKNMSSRLRAYYDVNDGTRGHIGYNWDFTDTHRAMCVSP